MRALILVAWSVGVLLGVASPASAATAPGYVQRPPVAFQQPTPPPEDQAPPPRVSLSVLLALVCVFNLSVIALLGSLALRRRIDRISPEK